MSPSVEGLDTRRRDLVPRSRPHSTSSPDPAASRARRLLGSTGLDIRRRDLVPRSRPHSTSSPDPAASRARRLLGSDLGPIAQLRAGRLGRRLAQLFIGLVLYGVSLALMVRGNVGLAPWDVLHSGMIERVPITLGQAVVLMSFVVLLLWIPLQEQPGIGTIANAVVVGLSADATLWVLDEPGALAARVALMVGGIVLCGAASGLYIGAQLGRGPRDGLMTGLARRTGRSLRLVRTLLEVAVVLVGLALGGVLGAGTVAYAFTIGPLTQLFLPWCLVDLEQPESIVTS